MSSMQTWLVELSAAECADLLARTRLGRLGMVVDGRPEIVPVNHLYDAATGCVVFPAHDRRMLEAALGWPWVAYEVDGMAEPDEDGWSVMVLGRAEQVTDLAPLEQLATPTNTRWLAEPRSWVRIVPSKVTGRRVSAVMCG